MVEWSEREYGVEMGIYFGYREGRIKGHRIERRGKEFYKATLSIYPGLIGNLLGE
jgi:hypothetical protein